MSTYTRPSGTYYKLFEDMTRQPHLLIAGATGSGKSVAINGIISTLMYRFPNGNTEKTAKLILIDPKKVELAAYASLPHTLMHADGFAPEKWLEALDMAVRIMDERYTEMKRQRVKEYRGGDVYVIIDEWANVFKNGGKPCYKAVLRLISEGRAAHVHVIMATQVPKADIIPTEIRENFSARLCLRTNNSVQSRVIMEENGCEALPRFGQGYYVKPEGTELWKIPYVQQEELDRQINWWEKQRLNNVPVLGLFRRMRIA